MIGTLKQILQESSADRWRVSCEYIKGWEFYLIADRLDQNRIRNVHHIEVTVFMNSEDGTKTGSASAPVSVSDNEPALRRTVSDLAARAAFAMNPYYDGVRPSGPDILHTEYETLEKRSRDILDTLKTVPVSGDASLNSCEVFTDEVTRRIITSEGIDMEETVPATMIETVVNAREGDHEIEVYRMYRSGLAETAAYREQVEEAMKTGRDRLHAVKTPALGKIPVLFTNEHAAVLCSYFTDRMDAAYIYRKMSTWKKGSPVCDAQCDRVTLESLRYLPGSPANRSFDGEGSPVRDAVLIRDGIAERYWGGHMYSTYIGEEDSFILSNYRITGGTYTEAQLRTGKYLEVREFSDFHCDPATGDIFGEIRLAYLHDGEDVIPVTGGSVSGSMLEFARTLKMSRNVTRYGSCEIPAVIRLEGVTVAGFAE
ncbi:MAG: TldD/PmbA family protein [Solobacterium sp.]|nr:TldD/PmbA family protein [Solobacterium sp.]